MSGICMRLKSVRKKACTPTSKPKSRMRSQTTEVVRGENSAQNMATIGPHKYLDGCDDCRR